MSNALPEAINAAASPEVQSNDNFAALAALMTYAHAPTLDTSALIRGYSGGRWGGFAFADTAHTFGTSTTTYVSVKIADGTIDFSTSNTHYNDASNYCKVETVVTSGSAITSVTDDRAGPGGVHGGGSGSGGSVTFSATQRVLGRNSAGAGAGEEVTLTQLLDWIGSAAQGDILIRGSSAWARLAAGTAGQVLKTGGTGANPAWADNLAVFQLACSDRSTALTTGTDVASFRAPFAFKITSAYLPRASVDTVSSSGAPTFDIKQNGTSIFTTKVSIDASEKTSTTAATAAVLTGTISVADDDEITIDITAAGTGTKGAIITIIGVKS